MSNFGEMTYESSYSCADDEEDEPSDNPYGLVMEWTDEGEKYIKEATEGSHTFCSFVGKVAVGFGEGFLGKKEAEEFTLLAQVYMTGNEGTVDMYTQRPKRKPAVHIYLGGKGSPKPVIFAIINFYGVPRVLANELAYKMSELLRLSSEVVVFHSEPRAYFRGEGIDEYEGKLLYLQTCFFKKDKTKIKLNPPKAAECLPSPNIISGPSAAILSYCKMITKPALMLITYYEAELVDSISMKPFFKAIEQSKGLPPSGFDLGNTFSSFKHRIQGSDWDKAAMTSNLYV